LAFVRTADELLQAPFQQRPFQEHSPSATEAPQSDIGAEASDLPVGTAAGMRPLEPHHVIEV
jgi:hypothetical protein